MNKFETEAAKKIHGLPLSPGLAAEIEQALEMMRRVKRVAVARGATEIQEDHGNTYVVPDPVYYPASRSS